MELIKHFLQINIELEWTIFCLLPVSSSEVETINYIDRTHTSKLMSLDINEFYGRVIYRNNTLTDLLTRSRSILGKSVTMCQIKFLRLLVSLIGINIRKWVKVHLVHVF